ncbi:hypothetical protein ALO81_200165 [Pseudomonas cannabina]|uniref:Conjugal transfer protein n=1 Tax=Pseudomonas cannabina TaxID=86840 RepID=A0A0P9M675_PSECA|nr:hypothetical protein ALO81_200165 [Pseudomonas cannabina]
MSHPGQFVHLFLETLHHALLLLLTVELELLLGILQTLLYRLIDVRQSLFERLVVLLDGRVLRHHIGDLLLELAPFSHDRA